MNRTDLFLRLTVALVILAALCFFGGTIIVATCFSNYALVRFLFVTLGIACLSLITFGIGIGGR